MRISTCDQNGAFQDNLRGVKVGGRREEEEGEEEGEATR